MCLGVRRNNKRNRKRRVRRKDRKCVRVESAWESVWDVKYPVRLLVDVVGLEHTEESLLGPFHWIEGDEVEEKKIDRLSTDSPTWLRIGLDMF